MRDYSDDPVERDLEMQLEWERLTRPPLWVRAFGLVAGVFGVAQLLHGIWRAVT